MSWIVTSPKGLVFELFDYSNVKTATRLGWKVETAQEYLGRINAEIRGGARDQGRNPDHP